MCQQLTKGLTGLDGEEQKTSEVVAPAPPAQSTVTTGTYLTPPLNYLAYVMAPCLFYSFLIL